MPKAKVPQPEPDAANGSSSVSYVNWACTATGSASSKLRPAISTGRIYRFLREVFINSRLHVFLFSSWYPHSRFIPDSLKAPWRGFLFPAAPPSRGGHRPPPHTEESAGQGCRESRWEWHRTWHNELQFHHKGKELSRKEFSQNTSSFRDDNKCSIPIRQEVTRIVIFFCPLGRADASARSANMFMACALGGSRNDAGQTVTVSGKRS